MLTFLGKGSCFNVGECNTSAYYKDHNRLVLIDCGESVFKEIIDQNILNDISELNILITHLHSDHVGSLPSLIFYCEFILKIKPTIIYPEPKKIKEFLTISGNNPESYDLKRPEDSKIRYVKQLHSEFINSYGYLFELKNKMVYFSGDTKEIETEVLELFLRGGIDYFYQDVSEYETPSHLKLSKLEDLIPSDKRQKVWCMHFTSDNLKNEILTAGFNV